MTSWSFQTVWRMREAWNRETYVRSQSFSSESAVKYLHVGRRKIQISPPLGEQDQSNALTQGQQRQPNPPPLPRPPPPPTNKHCWPVYASIWPQTARINKRREYWLFFHVTLTPNRPSVSYNSNRMSILLYTHVYSSLATASTRQCITCYGRDGTIASRSINRENDIEDLVNFKKAQFVLGSHFTPPG